MPATSPDQVKVHRLGILLTPSGTRLLCCKDCALSIDITEGSDAAMKAARNKAKRIACTNTPNAFTSDWQSIGREKLFEKKDPRSTPRSATPTTSRAPGKRGA